MNPSLTQRETFETIAYQRALKVGMRAFRRWPERKREDALAEYMAKVWATWVYNIEKGKDPLADQYHRENLNFTLVRAIPMVATWIIGFIPYIGWILGILLWIVSIVLFVFHLMAAIKATENFKKGIPSKFIFNIDFVK